VIQEDEPVPGRLSDLVDLPTLVVHGSEDPLFPPAARPRARRGDPGARYLELDGVGHELPPPATWDVFVDALVEHTNRSGP
jgi:pimeloyl-ACP methyl ester carboxylesterase